MKTRPPVSGSGVNSGASRTLPHLYSAHMRRQAESPLSARSQIALIRLLSGTISSNIRRTSSRRAWIDLVLAFWDPIGLPAPCRRPPTPGRAPPLGISDCLPHSLPTLPDHIAVARVDLRHEGAPVESMAGDERRARTPEGVQDHGIPRT